MARRRAFTLIELLVVILIISLLIAISVMVGKTVIGGGKKGQTENTIRVLEMLLTDIIDRDGIPPPYVEDPHNAGSFMPIIDGRNMALEETNTDAPGYQVINSVGLFLFQLRESSSSSEALEGIDAKLRGLYTPYSPNNAGADEVVHEIPTIFDGWGNPIRYVHPAWDARFWGNSVDDLESGSPSIPSEFPMISDALNVFLPQGGEWAIDKVRRNSITTGPGDRDDQFGDSDGGLTANQRPYFYSAGADGKVGFDDLNNNGELDANETDYNKDNVYTNKPSFKN